LSCFPLPLVEFQFVGLPDKPREKPTSHALLSLAVNLTCGSDIWSRLVGTRTAFLQIALLRPLSKLMTRTTNPTTSSKWIRLPPICKPKPRSHKIMRTTKMVQSMSTCCAHLRAPECESHPQVRGENCFARTDKTTMDCAPTRIHRRRLMTNNRRGRVRKPYFLSALASAFAPRTSARNGWATAGAGTLPNSKARVVTLLP